MPFDPEWIEVPVLLTDEQLEEALAALREAKLGFETEELPGISRYESDVLAGRAEVTGQRLKNLLRFRRDQAQAAARALADALELEDPDQVRPFTGNCPSCGAAVSNSWTCSSCELGFHSRFERDDPMIAFVRQYGGFA
jgi:hypothetical protein